MSTTAPTRRFDAWPWNLSGVAVTAVEGWRAIAVDRQSKRLGTTVKPFQQSSVLVTNGESGFGRHPLSSAGLDVRGLTRSHAAFQGTQVPY